MQADATKNRALGPGAAPRAGRVVAVSERGSGAFDGSMPRRLSSLRDQVVRGSGMIRPCQILYARGQCWRLRASL
jgi:hypothetical protein